MYYNHYLDIKPPKKYNKIGNKDNLNDLFGKNLARGNPFVERPHKKVTYRNTEVQNIFENEKNNLPVGYKELSTSPGKTDFEEKSNYASKNIDNIRKYGRKPLKKDF